MSENENYETVNSTVHSIVTWARTIFIFDKFLKKFRGRMLKIAVKHIGKSAIVFGLFRILTKF